MRGLCCDEARRVWAHRPTDSQKVVRPQGTLDQEVVQRLHTLWRTCQFGADPLDELHRRGAFEVTDVLLDDFPDMRRHHRVLVSLQHCGAHWATASGSMVIRDAADDLDDSARRRVRAGFDS
jgi:hypothetical protein